VKCPQVCSSPQLPSVSLKRPSPTMALSVLYTLAKVASSRPTPECSLLFGSTPYGPQATPTAEPSTSWSPHATSPSCPYDSVGDSIKICPSKFPTFPPTKEVAPSCEVAVIGALRACDPPPHSHAYHARCCLCARPGAGTGGLYTALRLVDTGTVAASAICIFEMTGRVGGRIMSLRGLGPEEDLVVDVGAYRTWPKYTPIAHALITDYLGLPVHCYDPGDVPCAKFNIATEVGSDRKAGFGTFVEEMMNRLVNAGARWFPNYELKAIAQSSAPADKQLTFGNGAQAVASKLILNMPQRALLKVLRASSLPMGALDGGYFEALYTVATEALHTVATEIVTNVYLCAKERVVANHTVGWFAAPTARWVCRPAVHKLLAVRRP